MGLLFIFQFFHPSVFYSSFSAFSFFCFLKNFSSIFCFFHSFIFHYSIYLLSFHPFFILPFVFYLFLHSSSLSPFFHPSIPQADSGLPRLVRRMTRFFVTTDATAAIKHLSSLVEELMFTFKKNSPGQVGG